MKCLFFVLSVFVSVSEAREWVTPGLNEIKYERNQTIKVGVNLPVQFDVIIDNRSSETSAQILTRTFSVEPRARIQNEVSFPGETFYERERIGPRLSISTENIILEPELRHHNKGDDAFDQAAKIYDTLSKNLDFYTDFTELAKLHQKRAEQFRRFSEINLFSMNITPINFSVVRNGRNEKLTLCYYGVWENYYISGYANAGIGSTAYDLSLHPAILDSCPSDGWSHLTVFYRHKVILEEEMASVEKRALETPVTRPLKPSSGLGGL